MFDGVLESKPSCKIEKDCYSMKMAGNAMRTYILYFVHDETYQTSMYQPESGINYNPQGK